MSMQELTDDQLDGLFRKSAEEFEPPYDPAPWDTIKDELDDRDRRAFWKRWLPWGIPVLLLLMIGGTWYAYRKVAPAAKPAVSTLAITARPAEPQQPVQAQGADAPATRAESATDPSAGLMKATEKEEETEPGKPDNSGSESVKPTARVDKPRIKSGEKMAVDPSQRSLAAHEAEGNRAVTPALRAAPASSKRIALSVSPRSSQLRSNDVALAGQSAGKEKLIRKQRTRKQDFGAPLALSYATGTKKSFKGKGVTNEAEPPRPTTTGSTLPVETIESGPVALPDMAGLPIRPGQWPKLPGLSDKQVTQPEQAEPVSVAQPPPARGFSVRLAVAPDLSSIGLQNFSKPGTNVGLLLEYRLSSRWSVQTGVIRSTKIYEANSSQYDADNEYWSKFPAKPGGIYGECNMLDVPVNVRYDFALRPRSTTQWQPSRWFVSGGITSYIMLKEDYTYENYPPHTYNAPMQWSTNSGSYGLSQMNLSVGYERALSRRLSWQVEPFMKVPLKGVGFFKIDLLSTGAFLSLRYKL